MVSLSLESQMDGQLNPEDYQGAKKKTDFRLNKKFQAFISGLDKSLNIKRDIDEHVSTAAR